MVLSCDQHGRHDHVEGTVQRRCRNTASVTTVQIRPEPHIVRLVFEPYSVRRIRSRITQREARIIFWYRRRNPPGGKLGRDELEHITVGDPDPTSQPPTAYQCPMCQFQWIDEKAQVFILLWTCTRQLGHQGQHIAGTGEWVAAVRDDQQDGSH